MVYSIVFLQRKGEYLGKTVQVCFFSSPADKKTFAQVTVAFFPHRSRPYESYSDVYPINPDRATHYNRDSGLDRARVEDPRR